MRVQIISGEHNGKVVCISQILLKPKEGEFPSNANSKDAVLLPTVSDTPRTERALIKDYFDTFLKKKPQGTILDGKITIGANWAQDCSIHEFKMGADGSTVKARYTFVYVYDDDKWKIAHHHWSMMPEKTAVGQFITKEQVRNLFHLWNDALASLDSDAVANR
jgi:hypothetical protein